jgi:hypothetical protein
VNPQPITESWSAGRPVGTGTHDASATVITSAKLPMPASAFAWLPSGRVARRRGIISALRSQRCVSCRKQCQHVPHTGVIEAITRSPGRTRDTPLPVHSTIPVASWPSMIRAEPLPVDHRRRVAHPLADAQDHVPVGGRQRVTVGRPDRRLPARSDGGASRSGAWRIELEWSSAARAM